MSAIQKEMKVADIFESYPSTRPIFKEFGFGALTNPILRHTFGKFTSIENACKMHSVDLDIFLSRLNCTLDQPNREEAGDAAAAPDIEKQKPPQKPYTPDELIRINQILNLNIHTITNTWPNVKSVFVKYFGEGCFSCPAFGTEDVAFACSMHNTDPIAFARECLELMGPHERREAASLTGINLDQTVNEMIRDYPETLRVLHRYGIDSCCGGDKPVRTAATAHQISVEKIAGELNEAVNKVRK